MRVLVSGAGGFLGGHLVAHLRENGAAVTAVDIKPLNQWWQIHQGVDSRKVDCSDPIQVRWLHDPARPFEVIYNLAADMGGMGFIANHKIDCMRSVLIGTTMLEFAAQQAQLCSDLRFFYSSSACVYPDYKQDNADVIALKEADAYPAMPEDGYGWEKLFTERLCQHYLEEKGLQTKVARYHNVYGPNGSWKGGREKAPAAICRKVAVAVLTGVHDIDIWGDGEQTRSFMYVDDCVKGTILIAHYDYEDFPPVNLGSAELVTINELVTIVEGIAGVQLNRKYQPNKPQGVRGRNSDNRLIRDTFHWEPSITLQDGLEKTYAWVHDQVAREV